MGVPDTSTFSLQDVSDGAFGGYQTTLVDCFDQAQNDYFDSDYVPSGFDSNASDKRGFKLYYFRNYGSHNNVSISVDPTSKHFESFGGSFGLQITTNPSGAKWTATTSESWINLSSYSGYGSMTITVYIAKYNSSFPRLGNVTISLDNFTVSDAVCNIDQAGTGL